MSIYEITVNAFIHLLNERPTLLSPSQQEELTELLIPLSSLEQLSDTLATWCEEDPQLDEALQSIESAWKEKAAQPDKEVDSTGSKPSDHKNQILNLLRCSKTAQPPTPATIPKSSSK
ncbi:MAG: hypothetical protein HC877_07460 [Thioploca sp.]|nr:hypothetical protein [Thioploca sp.]